MVQLAADRGSSSGPAPDRSTQFATLTSPEAHRVRGSVVLVPIGAVEQHGPHLPLGTDIWLATAVARAAADRLDGVYLAEALPIGCSAHHRFFPGTLSLRVSTFIAVVTDVATCLAEDGFIPVFVNGHGGNQAPLGAALQALLETGVPAWGVTYFELLRAEALAQFDDPRAVGHACALETSLSLALWPELVHQDRFPPRWSGGSFPDASLFGTDPVVRHRRFETIEPSGVIGDPSQAGTAAGSALLEVAVSRLTGIIDRILQEPVNTQGRQTTQ